MGADRIRLDVHAHLIPVGEEALASFPGVEWDGAVGRLVIDGHSIGLKSLFQPEALIAWMDAQAVEEAWISVPPPTYRGDLDDAGAAAWARVLNAGLAGVATAYPSRLSPLFHLPVERPAVALAILTEHLSRGDTRFAMSAGGAGVNLSDPAYELLWARLDETSGFLFLHPGEGCDVRFDPFYLHNLLGNPSETALAAGHLVFSGVPARYPQLTICLAHAGGATAAVAGRWQRGFDTARPGVDTSLEGPRAALKRFCVDCIAHDQVMLELAESSFGSQRVLFGSDWPFPMGLSEPHVQLAGLPPARRRAIFCDNAEALLTG